MNSSFSMGASSIWGPGSSGKDKGKTVFSIDEAAAIQRKLISEEDIRPGLHGVVCLKIKTATLITSDRRTSHHANTYVSVIVRNFYKRTKVVSNASGVLSWDQTKHFSLPVVRNKRHPFNVIRINLMSFEDAKPEAHSLVGSIAFHLHDIISASPIAGRYDIWNEKVLVGDIELEITFNYGVFGYGYSPQLKEDDVSPVEMVTYSLFPRINPAEDQREPDDPVLVAKATPHPAFVPFKEQVFLSYGKEIEPALRNMESQMYSPEVLQNEMDDFEEVRSEYYKMNDRVERIMFLHNHLHKSQMQQELIARATITEVPSFSSKAYTRFVQPLFQNMPKQDTRNNMRRRFTVTANDAKEKDRQLKQAYILKTAVLSNNK